MILRQIQKLTRKFHWRSPRCFIWILPITIALFALSSHSVAQSLKVNDTNTNLIATLWMLIAGVLVFFMNAGFAMVETGFCSNSNAVNVLAKNLIVFCVSSLAYWLIGFGLMFGDSFNGLVGSKGFFFEIIFPSVANPQPFPDGFSELQKSYPGISFPALFFFQLAFAGTTGTIISGAIAERVKFWAFLLFSFFLVGIFYAVTGHWAWSSSGLLYQLFKFRDFAGSTVVHSVGGAAALVGAILLKPRNGRFGYNLQKDIFDPTETKNFPPYNLGFATLGCFIVWFGWFGFNGGSAASLENVSHVIATTMIAGAFGGLAPILFSYVIVGKPSLGSIINGILGGLVGITASSAYVNIKSAIVIGVISGIVVLIVEVLLKHLKIDDPVGAVPVHLGCGCWGTLAVGIFSDQNSLEYTGKLFHTNNPTQLLYQFFGWMIIVGTTALLSWVAWILIGILLHYWEQFAQKTSSKSTSSKQQRNFVEFIIELHEIGRKGLRVSENEERSGSDGVFYRD